MFLRYLIQEFIQTPDLRSHLTYYDVATCEGNIFTHPNNLLPQIQNSGLAYQGKDIVFRFIIE
jgi:hypothetical protein